METQTLPPEIDDAQLDVLGQRLSPLWLTYSTDRKIIEEHWLRNLRQVRGIYDPEVKKLIPQDKSKAYPKMTAWMVRGTIARLMQLLFPQTEKNWGLKASPLPDLSTEQLQQVLDQLVAAKAQGGDPSQVQLGDDEIEKAIAEFAKGKAEKMEIKLTDDLQEMEFVTLARKVVRSAVIYNLGILKGPLHRKVKARIWQRDVNTGRYTAKEIDKYKPLFEFEPVWDHYPDLTAVSIDRQDGKFDRTIMTRGEVQDLASRPDFISKRVTDYLKKNDTGNYKAQWFETEIKSEEKSGQSPVQGKESRKYEVLSYWGGVTGRELRGAGVVIPDADLGTSLQANVWMLDSTVVKAKLAPLGQEVKHHHYFVFEDDDLSILGNGQCDVLRDTQISLCETVRAALDNASVIGPMAVMNPERMVPGQKTDISKHMTILAEDLRPGESLSSVAMNLSIDSHLPDLLRLTDLFLGFGDKESGLPPASLGDTTGGGSEALRTSKNASMFLGAAALPIRDTVRNFDTFTISMISALVAWNTKYDADPSRDGDHDVIARGSTSLIAKEVLSQALTEFKASITPEDAPYIKRGVLLKEVAKAHDLPVDTLFEDDDTAKQNVAAQQQAMASQAAGQAKLIDAQANERLAAALEHGAKARSEDASIGTAVLQLMIEAVAKGDKGAVDKAKTLVAAHLADSSRIAAEKPAPTGGNK